MSQWVDDRDYSESDIYRLTCDKVSQAFLVQETLNRYRRISIKCRRFNDTVKIPSLPSLELIRIECDTGFELNIEHCQKLKYLLLNRCCSASIASANTLDYIFFNNIPRVNRRSVAIPASQKVKIANTDVSDVSISNPLAVYTLSLTNTYGMCRASSWIRKCGNLGMLDLSEMPSMVWLNNLESISSLKELRLYNCGPIPDLTFLHGFQNLERIHIIGNTNVKSGDLTSLKELKFLHEVRLVNRKHYNMRVRSLSGSLDDFVPQCK